jgi:hypothetical protein
MSYEDIERVAYAYGGVVYGGYIRDKMIATYYTQNYYLKGNAESDFYNAKIHKSSVPLLGGFILLTNSFFLLYFSIIENNIYYLKIILLYQIGL